MKKTIEILVLGIIPGLLASAVITEITVNGKVTWSEMFTKPSFYILLAYLVIILIYFLSGTYFRKVIKIQKEQIIKSLKDDLKNDLKSQIKSELQNEINQQIGKEGRGVKNEIRALMNGKFKNEILLEIKSEIQQDIEKATNEKYQIMEAYVYKLILQQQGNLPSNQNLYDIRQLHTTLESMSHSFQKLNEKMGG
jgi:gas vesicle protein